MLGVLSPGWISVIGLPSRSVMSSSIVVPMMMFAFAWILESDSSVARSAGVVKEVNFEGVEDCMVEDLDEGVSMYFLQTGRKICILWILF